LEGDEAKTRLVDKIITGVNILNQTVTALLDYTRGEQLNLRSVPVARLIEDCVEYERVDQENAQPAVDLAVDIPDRGLQVTCDPILMRQVLHNLLRNSREAMPQGGRVTIKAYETPLGKSQGGTSSAVCIEVIDTGEGIPIDIRDKIFRPFFSTKQKHNGAGLGLASVWKTVQSHGGEITIDSEVGTGATFRIILPANHTNAEGRA
jgi:signal transduction histidine kinase